ncbi:MAG: SpoIIE family protein phosphatase [Prevotella sp.]|nr:SpoIIE family protein phosphatase [Prevotella sp.]
MTNSLSARLTYRIMVVVLVMMAIISGVVYFTVKKSMLVEAQGRYLNVLRKIQGETRRITTMVDMATLNNAHDIEEDLDNPEKMFDHMERIVQLSDNIACCCLLFEPYYYPSKGRLFIPYARRNADGSVRVSRIDSTYHSYFSDVWFQEQIKNDRPDWTKPYFESQWFAGNEEPRLLKTYTVPIHNREGHPVALLCSDLSLVDMRNGIMKELEQVHQMYEKGCSHHSYSFMFSYDGVYLNHPDKQRIVNKNFVEEVKETPDTLDDYVLASMMKNPEGSAMVKIDGVPSWIYYQNIKQRRMIGAIVVPKEVIFHNGRRLNIIILLTMILGLIAIYLFCRRQIKDIADPFAAQKAAVDRELTIAHDIQMALLPKPFPEHADVDLYASLTPARNVGGDLYDYFLHKGRLVFCIGDVSGKGVPAALLMAVMRSMFRSEARRADSAADIVNAMNRNLCEEYTGGDFITMFVGMLDLATGHLDFCNAGHEAPLIAGQPLNILPNLPVGALSDWNYEGQQTQLRSGDMIFLYTDGLSEAKNTANQQFGRKNVVQLSNGHCTNTAQQLVVFMNDEVKRHAGDAEQSDDITLLAIRWQQPERLTMKASMDDIGSLDSFISHATHHAGMEERDAKRLRLAVEEAVANIINHGQATAITLQASVNENQLVLTIDDNGQPFDPTADSPTDLSVPADQRPPGGLGIMLIHKMADELNYQRIDGHNVLKIIKLKQ